MRARVVAAIADHDQGLLFPAAQADLFQRLEDRIVQRGLTAQWRLSDDGFQLIEAISEMDCASKAGIHPLIEGDYKHFVFGVARFEKSSRGRDYFVHLRAHASAVVDHEAHGDRNVLMAEHTDGLPHAVLIHLEILLK